MFQAAEVDDQSIGPDVSEDIQLVYTVDDVSESTFSYAGVGGNEGAVVAEGGAFQILCRNARGLIVDSANIWNGLPTLAENIVVASTAVAFGVLTGPAGPTIVLQSGPSPEALVEQGTTALLTAGEFRWLNSIDGLKGFFLANGETLTLRYEPTNTSVSYGIRWRELSRS